MDPRHEAAQADAALSGESNVTVDRAVKAYIKMRDRRSALKAAFEREDNVIKAQQEQVEGFLLAQLQSIGGKSIATEHGTVYQDISIKPSCQDWNSFYAFVREHDAFDLMEQRLGRNAIAKYMKDNEGRLPPGVSVFKEATVKIRRS
jgi:hypothetical protein